MARGEANTSTHTIAISPPRDSASPRASTPVRTRSPSVTSPRTPRPSRLVTSPGQDRPSLSLHGICANQRRAVDRRCQILLCRDPKCELRTHLEYGAAHARAAISAKPDIKTQAQVDAKVAQHQALPSIINGGVDGYPTLPVDGLPKPIVRHLFHTFFSYHYDHICSILAVPPVTPEQQHEYMQAKYDTLATALSAPVFSYHVLAATHHQVVFARDVRRPDRTTAIIHMKLLSLLREKLSNLMPPEVKDVAGIILILVMLDAAVGNLSVLPFHRKAVKHLVSSQGGLHNMQNIIPVIIVLDRVISLFTDEPPEFVSPVDRALRRPLQHPHVYGSHFDDAEDHIPSLDPEVKVFCFDVCRTIELIEKENVSFKPRETTLLGPRSDSPTTVTPSQPGELPPTQGSDLTYLFFLKDCMSTSFVHLNARIAACFKPGTTTACPGPALILSRAILLTAWIVDYVVLQDGYMVTITLHYANRVRALLYRDIRDICMNSDNPLRLPLSVEARFDSLHPVFVDNPNVLIWILFVLASMPLKWEGDFWCLCLLKEILDRKYHGQEIPIEPMATVEVDPKLKVEPQEIPRPAVGESTKPWPPNWRDLELHNAQLFVWSDTRLKDEFLRSCDRLTKLPNFKL